jgi:transglutaminase-like putative cysteine protease
MTSLPKCFRSTAVGFLVCTLATTAQADLHGSSVLHEYIPPDPTEDVSLSATTLDSDLPAAIETPSGLATAPDPRRLPSSDHVYGGTTTDDSPDATYEPDRDTRRPKVETYDDPFSPSTAPFKRLRAFDWIDTDYSLTVRDKALHPVRVGGSVAVVDEPFYADLSVDVVPSQPARIPSVGPSARILHMHVNPEVPVEMLHDGADNWFIRSTSSVRVHLVMELAIARDTFGRDFDDVDWGVLDAVEAAAAKASRFPTSHAHDAAYALVAQAIGISRAQRPRDVVRKMVEYFRDFAPSDETPTGHNDIYLDLALSRKGVCRHRSFAFLVTAIAIGIPARMVTNEAHAWVEAYDGRLWHRIDLGGAAANLDSEVDPTKPPYLPPPDPYAWPSRRDSGQDVSDRNRSQAAPASSSQTSAGNLPKTWAPVPVSSADPPHSQLPESEIAVSAIDGDVRRGFPLHLQGAARSAGATCPHLRVDVVLVPRAVGRSLGPGLAPGLGVSIGSLSTNERGRFDGAVIVPRDFALGDYDLIVATGGDTRCGPGRTL